VLRGGGTASIVAQVYSYAAEEDEVDFYYSSTPGPNPNWQWISTKQPPSGGLVIIDSGNYVLPASGMQAVRVSIRWKDENPDNTTCPTSSMGAYSDVDDLVFMVETSAPVTGKASYDSTLKAPKCEDVNSSGTCTTLGTEPPLLNKKHTGEVNGPNTIDSCSDGSTGEYMVDESIEAITVKANDADQGGVLRGGGTASIVAQVYSYAAEEDEVDFYYSSTPGPNPNWQWISTKQPPSGGLVIIDSGNYVLPASGMQAVRVSIRWTGENPDNTTCPTSSVGAYSDVDDLVFMVNISASVLPAAVDLPSSLDLTEEENIHFHHCATLNAEQCEKSNLCKLGSSSPFTQFFGLSTLAKKECSPKE